MQPRPEPDLPRPELLDSALVAQRAGNAALAEQLYTQILQSQPNHPQVNHNLGVLMVQRAQSKAGLLYLRRALDAQPQTAQFWLSYAQGLLAFGYPEEALAHLQRGQESGLTPDQAADLLARARQAVSDKAHPLHKALEYWRMGHRDQATHWLQDYVRQHPNAAMGHAQLGEFLRHQTGRLHDAIASLQRALALQPQSAIAWLSYASAQQQLGRHEGAIVAFRKALAINPALFQAANDLAVLLVGQGQLEEATQWFAKACALRPGDAALHMGLARALAKAQRLEEAAASARLALDADPQHASGALMFLAALGQAELPQRIPTGLLHKLYDARAATWDEGANTKDANTRTNNAKGSYCGAHLVGQLWLGLRGETDTAVLDAGCGTGLVGHCVKAQASRLDGVDLSGPMLEVARAKGLYDSLLLGDLVSTMERAPQTYNAVLSAATLIHFADLRPIFEAVARCLRPEGLFVFTTFPYEQAPHTYAVEHLDGMAQGGCFVHGEAYIEQLAKDLGFSVHTLERRVHEVDDNGQPKMCSLVCLRWPARVRHP